jgi:hypothetical protein
MRIVPCLDSHTNSSATHTRARQSTTLALVMTAALAAGCAKNVPQDSNSGKDQRAKGAKTIKLEDGEGRVRDIVTYPGGDRVDWKMVQLPEGEMGRLDIQATFKGARPGMDVAFNVYDEWFDRVGQAKPGKDKKRVKIQNARGKYYVEVYAPRRSDAVKYSLRVRFKKNEPLKQLADADLLAQIDDPPALPSIPQVAVPDPNAPGPGVGPGIGPVGPQPDPDPVETRPTVSSVAAKVVKVQVATGGGVIVTLNRGSNAGVDRGWSGNVLQGSGNSFLDGGEFKIIKVTKGESVAKIKLTLDQVKANPRVLLTP